MSSLNDARYSPRRFSKEANSTSLKVAPPLIKMSNSYKSFPSTDKGGFPSEKRPGFEFCL